MRKRHSAGRVRKAAAGMIAVVLMFGGKGVPLPDAAAESRTAVALPLGSELCTTAADTAQVEVTEQSLNTVSESIFGANVSWIDDGYGLWDSENDRPYAVLLKKLKNSGVQHIRYPGGIEGDYLHWYDTVGEISSREPSINCFSSEYPTYDSYNGVKYPVTFGVDELFRLCRAAGTKATVQLNAGNGTPQEASEYVQYLIEKGYMDAVDSICVGNEVCMSAEKVEDFSITKNPNDYIQFCKELFGKLGSEIVNKKSISLGVIGITPSHPLCAYKNWDIKVLDALASQIDFIDVHIGYSYYYQNGESRETSAKCFMASSKWISSMIQEEKGIIEKYAGEDADRIGIQITELGPNGGDYVRSVAGAVFLADLYNTVLSEPKILATDYLPLLNHYGSAQIIGAMTYSGLGQNEYYWDNAVSYVFKMYSKMIGKSVLTASVSGVGTFDSEPCGMVPAVKNVANADAAVYYSESDSTGSIFLINRSLTNNQKFQISLPANDIKITGVTELWNQDYMASNSYDAPNQVMLKTYRDYDTSFCGSIHATTKPVSLVRIDFQSDSIRVIPPVKTVRKASSTAASNAAAENAAVGKKGADVSGIKGDTTKKDPVRQSVVKGKKIKTILTQADLSAVVKRLALVGVGLFAAFLVESLCAVMFVLYRKRKE